MKLLKRMAGLMLSVTILCSLVSCFAESGTSAPDWTTNPNQEDVSQDALFEMLFDIQNKITISLDMRDSELQKMQDDYEEYSEFGSKSPIYRMADLYVAITTPEGKVYSYILEEVGVRMKGNTSRTDFYNSKDGIYNAIHLKISFQETFDEESYYGSDAKTWQEESARKERKNRTFATLEKLDLRWNRCDDGSYLKEYFAYETYRQYGVLAPHTNLCSFDWSGKHMGVYTINEPVDDVFLEKQLPKEALGGDLYKVGWAGWENGSFTSTHSIGIENEDQGLFFAYDLKTNKKTSQHENLIGFIQEMNSGNMTKDRFSQMVDLDNFIAFTAVSYLLGNPDDMRNNYNNFYIYFRADNGKIMFIPYDYDRCLGVTMHWNPTGNGVTADDPFTHSMAATDSPQTNPVILYSIVSGGYFVQEYANCLRQIIAGDWFTPQNFEALYSIANDHYASDAKPDPSLENTQWLHMEFDLERTSPFDANDNISFREYRDAKISTLNYYLSKLDEYLGGEPQLPALWYIRCDKTNWQNDNNFAMVVQDGLVTITLKVTDSIRLKVYNDRTGQWFGAECVREDCTVPYESDGHTNIVLQQGVYTILFDPETEIITLIKE